MSKILGIGNALVDILAQLDDEKLLLQLELPKGGMQLVDASFAKKMMQLMQSYAQQQATGGSAANAMLALAHLGAAPGLVGQVGDDELGHFFEQNCVACGIESRLMHVKGHTGVACTLVTPDGERTFGTFLGVSAMEASQLSEDLLSGFDLLHVEGYLSHNHELIETAMKLAKSLGMRVSLDLASYNVVLQDLPFFRHLVCEYVDVVFANEEEAYAYTGMKDPKESVTELAKQCSVAVVKCGANGAMAMNNEGFARAHSRKVNVVDTTAAGDFFAGGFLYAFTKDASLQQCLACGNRLGEAVIQIVGTQLDIEKWNEVKSDIKQILAV